MVGKSFPRPRKNAPLAKGIEANSSGSQQHNASAIGHSEASVGADADAPQISPEQINPELGKRSLRSWFLPILALLACTMTGGTAAIAFLSLTALPPETDCNQATTLDTDRGLLYCVQQAARSGEMEQVLAGLEVLGQWTPADPLYYEAQASLEKWSRTVLSTARQKLRNHELEDAIDLVHRIPQSSPLYDESQELLLAWQNQVEAAEQLMTSAQEALKQQDWDQVSQAIRDLGELTAYAQRSEQISRLSEQMRIEKESSAILDDVLVQIQAQTPQQIGLALEKAADIDQDTYVWLSAQDRLEPLAKELLSYGGLQWQQGHLDPAITTAKRVSIFPRLAAEAQHLDQLSHARKLAIATVTNWVPSPDHLFKLMEATSAARQIPASSQFYAQAQDSLKSWEAQFADISHLQLAQMSAQIGWSPAVEWASSQATQLAPERPRRTQAQTLAAHWDMELERIKDRRYLLWAHQLAQPGTRASLKMAITEAKKVERDRPLFAEAQGLIEGWTRDIHTQEDQPYLTLAQSLARQGELREAIKTAAIIQSGRPLYNTARSAIKDWQGQIWAQQRAEQQRLARRRARERPTVRATRPADQPQQVDEQRTENPASAQQSPRSVNKTPHRPETQQPRAEDAIAPAVPAPIQPNVEQQSPTQNPGITQPVVPAPSQSSPLTPAPIQTQPTQAPLVTPVTPEAPVVEELVNTPSVDHATDAASGAGMADSNAPTHNAPTHNAPTHNAPSPVSTPEATPTPPPSAPEPASSQVETPPAPIAPVVESAPSPAPAVESATPSAPAVAPAPTPVESTSQSPQPVPVVSTNPVPEPVAVESDD